METQYIAMALTLFHVNMTSCTFYEYSLHGALRSLGVRVKRGVSMGVMGGVLV